MEMTEKLLADAKVYCESRGISLWRLGALAVNDGKFFKRLEDGGSCTLETFEKVKTFMAANPVRSSGSETPS